MGTAFACFLDSVEEDTSLNRSLETASVGWNSVWMTGRIFDDSTDCVVLMAPDCKIMRKLFSRQPVDLNNLKYLCQKLQRQLIYSCSRIEATVAYLFGALFDLGLKALWVAK